MIHSFLFTAVCLLCSADGLRSGIEVEAMLGMVAPGISRTWKDCSFEMFMLETRVPDANITTAGYWSLTAVINHEYARQFKYNFRVVRPNISNVSALGYSVNWLKPLYVRQRLEEMADTPGCLWLISMDSDSFVRESDLPLDVFLDGLAKKYGMKHDVGGVFAQEVSIQGAFTSPWHHVNAGVFMMQSNVHSRKLVNAWIESGRDDPDARVEWPAEQGTITELLFPGKYITKIVGNRAQKARTVSFDDRGHVGVVNMSEFNSPWGRFIEHMWSGPGVETRGTDPKRMLTRMDLMDEHRYKAVAVEVAKGTVLWMPPAF